MTYKALCWCYLALSLILVAYNCILRVEYYRVKHNYEQSENRNEILIEWWESSQEAPRHSLEEEILSST